jgi:hypothetical protein
MATHFDLCQLCCCVNQCRNQVPHFVKVDHHCTQFTALFQRLATNPEKRLVVGLTGRTELNWQIIGCLDGMPRYAHCSLASTA